ncbi:2-succinyl-5-enolpyruvyl-6-hydroxy-3-cyclohexene-1-carboxylic-acid synthase [Actinomyces sp. B33]|uniref:2-succinyl-5-enolpyruvyl-6-hydroxy-3- cyclohexene-1-carboxylic-acid synthase n=1 Tax=Actinomyces sp. B33 TaxID=2942131 RepID=UPI0023406296|nr:2-succinyl-5-enolpyruvyl-6-hydroxy-3-cyclohexene-1-carboxylic-acid synthase [Actinomyces sp. B33]MDC4233538.1 2-succinyl-5-enolpyruvyl-6-hydroxy-3-cyclohexene-1-carboxylic-acid synthase [Actinomyces sp. B33]
MTENPSILVARLVVRTLADCGVRDVVYCPGSRSAPLAHALDEAVRGGRIRAHVRLDERSAAFLAVGLSRGAGTGTRPAPVAVVTTSGGAVAELHAGIAEASHARLPIIAVSADRPFEMRGVGASQTTRQAGIFAGHVRDELDVPAGQEAGPRLAALVARLVAAARGFPTGTPGPVHLNIGLRDPLTPAPSSEGPSGACADGAGGGGARVLASAPTPVPWEEAVDPGLRTVVVAGDGDDPAVARWAAGRLPVLAEPTSRARRLPEAVDHQQSLLVGAACAQGVEQVVVSGRPTLSRAVSALLAREDVRIVVVDPSSQWTDVAGRAAVVAAALGAPRGPVGEDEAAWLGEWRLASRRARGAVEALIDEADAAVPTTPAVARAVWRSGEGPLLLGASSCVRAADLAAVGDPGRPVLSNRGLAGIDGTVATAIGVAAGSGTRVTALMGDLTFFHDAGALAVPTDEEAPAVDLVVVDDHGGSIFAGLEHGRPEYAPVFDRWFATPQETSVEALAAAHGAEYARVESMGAVREALVGTGAGGARVIHVPVESDPGLVAAIRDVLRR